MKTAQSVASTEAQAGGPGRTIDPDYDLDELLHKLQKHHAALVALGRYLGAMDIEEFDDTVLVGTITILDSIAKDADFFSDDLDRALVAGAR